jgi:hypothetical protein
MNQKGGVSAIFKENLRTTVHKFWVFFYILKVCWALIKRAFKHDLSKYSKSEAPYFAQAINLKNLKYGGEAYKKTLESIRPALEHHYKNNSHHPQHYEVGIMAMGILDWCEMLADWKAATRRTEGGSIKLSVEQNQERYMYPDEVKTKFINFLREVNLWAPSYNVYKKVDSKDKAYYTLIPDDAGWIYEQCERECELVFSSTNEKRARKYFESVSKRSEIE